MKQLSLFLVVVALFAIMAGGCSKRQIVPGVLVGAGGGMMVGGVAYRVSLESDELLGTEAEEKALTATLLLTGTALVIAGVVWSATTPVCEIDADCWIGDVCEPRTGTCVPRPAEEAQSSAATLRLERYPQTRCEETSQQNM